MSLSPPTARKLIHTRRVTCEGFQREDGLWDIEGRMIDTKTYDFPNKDRGGAILAGEPIHQMVVRATLDDQMCIKKVEAVTEFAPFNMCGDIAASFSKLEGLTIGPGFLKALRDNFSGVRGCTHIVELFGPIATTAFQTVAPAKHWDPNYKERPTIIDSCHALASDSPMVAREWPRFYDGKDKKA